MKILKSLVTALAMFMLVVTPVSASVHKSSHVCGIDAIADMTTAITDDYCQTIKLNNSMTATETYDFGDKRLDINGKTLTVDGGKLTFVGSDATADVTIDLSATGATLEIKNGGLVDVSKSKLNAIKAYAGGAKGTIKLDNGTLYLHDAQTGSGINNPLSVELKNGSTLRIENFKNGYGLTTNNLIDVDNSIIIAKGNKAGITGKIVSDDKSTITAENNSKIGITTKPDSVLDGTVVAKNNGTDTSIAENQRGDLAVNGALTINGDVTADKIVPETRQDYGNTAPDITVAGNGSLSYEEIDSDVTAPVVTNGVITGEDGIVVNFATDEDAHNIMINKTTKVTNNSAFGINVCTADSKVCTKVATGKSATITTYNVTVVNGDSKAVYTLIRGQKVTDLKDYENITKLEGFMALLKANGKEYDTDDAVNADLVLTIKLAEVVTPVEPSEGDNNESSNIPPVPQTGDGINGMFATLLAGLGTAVVSIKKFIRG